MRIDIGDFFQDLGNFFGGGAVLGVDIGTASMKAVEIFRKKGMLSLKNYGLLETRGYLEHPSRAIQTGALKLSEREAVRLLRILVRDMKIGTKKVFMSLPSFSTFITVLDMPELSPEETARAVRFQAQQFIPLPIDKVSLDWTKVVSYEHTSGGTYQKVLLMGVPGETVTLYQNIAKGAGLKLVGLEAESLSLARSLLSSNGKTIILIDIGALATNIIVGENGLLRHSSQADYGGMYLTHALAGSLGISMIRAEELKRKKRFFTGPGDRELSTLLLSFLDVIIEEVSNVRRIYEGRYGKKIDALTLTGGGAAVAGIEIYLGKQLELPAHSSFSFADIAYDPALEPVIKPLGLELSAAVGAAKGYLAR